MKYRTRLSTLADGEYHDNWLNSAQRMVDAAIGSNRECRLCHKQCGGEPLCRACTDDLPWRTEPWTKQLPLVDAVWVGFDFAYPVRQLIHRMKYGRDLACARILGELFAARLTGFVDVPSSAVLFPVPLARSRVLVRGFNQAVEISLPLRRALRLPIDVVSVHKRHTRKAQSTLDAVGRKANIRDAFKHRGQLKVDTAIIVDDVLTTGATVSAMARVLKNAGAKQVIACVLAAA